MFLDEAHRTTRNYSALKAKVGKDIFGKGHKMEPYYTAAFEPPENLDQLCSRLRGPHKVPPNHLSSL